jgi:hypothetical protein
MITEEHLQELVKDTPMGRVKMLAAWDSLSNETQIRLLGEMKGRRRASDRPIWLKALSSQSEYIRYLAARETKFDRDDEIVSKVSSDESALVCSVRNISTGRAFSLEPFESYPREFKLAVVSDDDPPPALELARWIERSAEAKIISDDMLMTWSSNMSRTLRPSGAFTNRPTIFMKMRGEKPGSMRSGTWFRRFRIR